MRAFLIATTVFLLAVSAACGDSTTTSTGQPGQTSSVRQTQSAKPAPELPSVVAEPTSPTGKPQNPPPVTIGPDGPVVPAGVTEVPASQIDASGVPNYIEYGNRVWMYDDGKSLQLFATANSGCTGAEAIVTEQSADSVTIVARPLDGPQGGRPDDRVCTAVMTPVPVAVTLDAPLGDRKIVLASDR